MMQKKMIGQEPALEKEALEEGRSAEEIREIIRMIEGYLARTKETIERLERFVKDLKQEEVETVRKENDRQEENREEKEKDSPSAHI